MILLADDDTSDTQHVSTAGVECPYCHKLQLPPGGYPSMDGTGGQFACSYCQRLINWRVSVQVVWTATK